MHIFNKINTPCILDSELGIYIHDKEEKYNNYKSPLPKIYLLGECLFTYTNLTTKEESLVYTLKGMLPEYNIMTYSFAYNTLINIFNTIKSVVEESSIVILNPISIRHPFSCTEVFTTSEINVILHNIVELTKIKKCILYVPTLKDIEFFDDVDWVDKSFLFDLKLDNAIYDKENRIKKEHYPYVCNELIEMIKHVPEYNYYCSDTHTFEQLIIENQKRDIFLIKTNKIYINYIKELANYSNMHGKCSGLLGGAFNPFTYGHLSLIEYAASKVDILYIITDKLCLEIPYEIRHKLLKIGVQHLKNVVILPTCELKNSMITFGDYVHKNYKSLIGVSFNSECLLSMDIIRTLGITTRFFGEEPECIITNKYIEDFKRINEAEGDVCNVEVIKRFKINDINISASNCRKHLKDGNYMELSKYLPSAVLSELKRI